MITSVKSIEVSSILFESNNSDVLIKGKINQDHLQYESDLIISHSQLNILLNHLGNQNENFEISNYLNAEPMYDGETLYYADFNENLNTMLSLNILKTQDNIKQIRA